jgi:Kef-type K+ transport system membrane component KefB
MRFVATIFGDWTRRLRQVQASRLVGMPSCTPLLLFAGLCGARPLLASDTPPFAAPDNPVAPVLVTLIILLLAAKLGGDIFERLGQPAVLGELLFGVVLGNLGRIGLHGLEYLEHDRALEVFSELGVILLLFEVGLESDLRELLSVGLSSALVASIGVITPMLLGLTTSWYFHSGESMYLHLFVGATLCATSVGITARVLQDLGQLRARESRIVLGAAVIDDVLGLIVLATVTGMITAAAAGSGAAVSAALLGSIVGKALGFLLGAVAIGYVVSPPLLRLAARFRVRGMLLTTSLLVCFLLSYLAQRVGLAPIVGAFAAGLILEERHYAAFRQRGEPSIRDLLSPLVTFLVPLFFVRMGLLVDLTTLGNPAVLGFAAALTAAAILGKQACALGVLETGLDRLSVGLGMIPRGEVGLIFANVGAALLLDGRPVIGREALSAIVIMIAVTTMVTPPLLRWSLHRRSARTAGAHEALPQPRKRV